MATEAPAPPVGGLGGVGGCGALGRAAVVGDPAEGGGDVETEEGGSAGDAVGAVAVAMVGSLIVGADVGFGGKAMRTVSFLGCTLAASAGFGGPLGGKVGFVSAIIILCAGKKLG